MKALGRKEAHADERRVTTERPPKRLARSEPSSRARWSGEAWRQAIRLWLGAVIVAYPVCLAVVAGLLHFVGEAHWATTIGLYLPAVGYLVPALPLGLLAAWLNPRLLLAPVVGAGIALVPLMGFRWTLGAAEDGPHLRVLSYNVDTLSGGVEAVVEQIRVHDVDLVLLQESDYDEEKLIELLQRAYPHVERSTQFVLASRFPVRETTKPRRLRYFEDLRSPRFLRYLIETPLGALAVYNVHPLSPRDSLSVVRGEGLRRELVSGRLFRGVHRRVIEANTGLRALQIETVGRMAREESVPVIVAGDLNLPSPSPLLRRSLGFLQDGFAAAGRGFGYTFPTKRPFLRLDRVMVSEDLRVTRFEVGCGRVSDHHCVIADLTGANGTAGARRVMNGLSNARKNP